MLSTVVDPSLMNDSVQYKAKIYLYRSNIRADDRCIEANVRKEVRKIKNVDVVKLSVPKELNISPALSVVTILAKYELGPAAPAAGENVTSQVPIM
jgi:hypothetical protein